jgi:hypothetical protein
MVALAPAPAAVRGRRLVYQDQDSPLTLAQGLAEYYGANIGRVARPDTLPPESRALFVSHDCCHVIFGLDTTLADEALVDARTLLSCDVGWRRYLRYLKDDAQAQAIFAEVGTVAAVAGSLAAVPRLLRAVVSTLRLRRRWPWTPPMDHMSQPLGELRRRYGIRVI